MRNQGAQLFLVSVQSLEGRRRLLAAERHDRDSGEFEIGRHADCGNSHRTTADLYVEHFAARENLGERMPNEFAHPLDAVGRSMES